jgi:outer membrane protein assembly factor BamB
MARTRRVLRSLVLMVLGAVVMLPGTATGAPAAAAITLEPDHGPPTTEVTVSGKGFGANEKIAIRFDVNKVGKATADGKGKFIATITVPASATPKRHPVKAIGQTSGRKAIAPFLVRTDWASFRFDPSGSGANPYENVLSPSNVGSLQVSWQKKPGTAIDSSPTIAGGMLYIGSSDGSLYALDADTGADGWSYATGGAVHSSPAIWEGVVYFGSDDGKVYALDAATGAFKWSYATGGHVSSSPVVSAGVVYVGSEDGSLYALDAASGAFTWSYATDDLIVSSPAVADGAVFVGSNDDSIYALDQASGTPLWSYPTGGAVTSSPAVGGGLVVVGSNDGYLYAVDEQTGAFAWYSATGGIDYLSPSIANGVVFAGGGPYEPRGSEAGRYPRGKMYGVDLATGDTIWTRKLAFFYGSPAAAGGLVFVPITNGAVYALDASTGSVDWSTSMADETYSGVAVADGRLFTADYSGNVYAFGLP